MRIDFKIALKMGALKMGALKQFAQSSGVPISEKSCDLSRGNLDSSVGQPWHQNWSQ